MARKIYLIVCISLLIVACRKKPSDLPRSLTVSEIKQNLPTSERFEVGPIETSLQKHALVDVQQLDEEILVELKYSTEDNFFKKDAYGTLEVAYLQPEVAIALAKASSILREKEPNLRLLVYDAARPHSVQHVLWQALDSLPKAERKKYVASPEEISLHNYGCAVDLTIYNLHKGRPVDMGTAFDFFGELAYPKLERQMLNQGKLSPQQISNRLLLREVMEAAGFAPITTEWWHFNYYSRNVASSKFRVID